jgi:hypothetical protein
MMKLILPILDLKDVSADIQYAKILEEVKELGETEIASYKDLGEALDVIQAAIGYIQVVYTENEIESGIASHYVKLENRNRKIKGRIKFTMEVD